MLLYGISLLLVLMYLWWHRRAPLGASMFFFWVLLAFHGPMLFFFTEVWSEEFKFGLLPHLTSEISTPDIIPRVYLAMSACVISTLSGMIIYSMINPPKQRSGNTPWGAAKLQTSNSKLIFISKISSTIIIIFLLTQFIFVAPPSELFSYYVSGIDEFDKVAIRRSATLSFYPYQVLLTAFFPFLSFILIAQNIYSKQENEHNKALRYYAIFFASLVLFAKISQYNKSGPVIYILQIFIVTTYARTQSFRMRTWHLWMALLALIFILVITALVNSTEGWELTFFSAFDRTFMIPNEGIFEYFAAIPDHLSHTFGSGIGWIKIFTAEKGTEDAMATYWKVAAVVRGDYGSTSNSFFIADAWAEFSWLGVILFSLTAGVLVRWHDHQVAKWGASPTAIAMLVSGYSGVYTLGTTALSTAMLTGGLILTPLLANLLLKNRRTHRKHN